MTQFLSFSANFEDLIFHRIFRDKPKGVYVDVGAEHPTHANDTFALYQRGWRGINLEPNNEYFKMLVAARPEDKNLCLALSATEQQAQPFYCVEKTGLSTFDKAYADKYVADGWKVTSTIVDITTLAKLLEREAITEIDILKVDVEGFEEQVLRGNDWARFRPSLIMLEATIPQSPARHPTQIRPFLEGNGYRYAHFDGLNDFYIEQSFTVPENAFLPPNIFDNAISLQMQMMREDTIRMLREKQALVVQQSQRADSYLQKLQAQEAYISRLKAEMTRVGIKIPPA